MGPGTCPKCGMALERNPVFVEPPSAIWTCPMHPQSEEDHPGSCPICGMALERKIVSAVAEENHELDDMTRRLWIGGALTALLVGRLAYRFIVMGAFMHSGAAVPAHGPAPGDSPLTMAVIGLTLGYYLAYYAGILVHHRRFKRQALAQAA